ncbi:uncharacterized protein LOC124532552 isoform X1 [Vanessa cardui]|uniref:uncharacterized protein LOC124532552 isoform X1 n=1 Tax=Vanessa cardui TaxID=171605 RepID=UPI001F14642B|nr:uncharacterized protein LOC124532552 isoform X1 [Vanessa cardui]
MLAIAFVFIVSVSLQHTYAASAKHPMEAIQYPEPIDQETEHIPDSCKDLTYCTVKPKDYPEEKFNKMFKDYSITRRHRRGADDESSATSKSQLKEASEIIKVVPQPSMVVELNNRQGGPDSADNCESIVTYEPLYKVRPKRDEPWRTVIQVPGKDIIQRVRLETCTTPNAPCFKELSPLPEFVTFCRQKINVWEVMVAKGDNETEMIKAELPVCCSCHYRELDFKVRFGKPKK